MPKQVILDFPGELPEEGLQDPEILKEAKTGVVLEMLRKGIITQERAADLLEIEPEVLSGLMAVHGISGDQPTPEKLTDSTTATAGAWKDLLDCEEFEREVYTSRRQAPRPQVRL